MAKTKDAAKQLQDEPTPLGVDPDGLIEVANMTDPVTVVHYLGKELVLDPRTIGLGDKRMVIKQVGLSMDECRQDPQLSVAVLVWLARRKNGEPTLKWSSVEVALDNWDKMLEREVSVEVLERADYDQRGLDADEGKDPAGN